MSGAVTWEAALALLAAMVTILGFVAGVWWRIEGRIEAARREGDGKAQAAHTTATLAIAQLAEFKIEAARTYMGKDDVQHMRDQILGAVGDVSQSVQHMNERLDRMNERLDRTIENSNRRQPVRHT